MTKKKVEVAVLKELDLRMTKIKIKGISPLIMHKWSEKVKKEMLDKQMKKTVKKEAKDPEEQFESSVYRLDDGGLCFPADAFKASMVRGAKALGLVMKDMKSAFFVEGIYSSRDDRLMVPISGKLEMREDMVRLQGTTSDIRFRGQIVDWTAELEISYNAEVVSFDQIVNMLQSAGFGVGIGEWRPSSPNTSGTFGRFEVVK